MGRITATASGGVATIRSPIHAPIRSLKAYFSPVQSGSGDPSPSNVRPITGRNGIDTFISNNAYPFYQGGIADANGVDNSAASRIKTDYIPYNKETSLLLNVYGAESSLRLRSVACYRNDKTFINAIMLDSKTPPYQWNVSVNTSTAYFRIVCFMEDKTSDISPNGKCLTIDNYQTIPVSFPAVGKNLLNPAERNDTFTNNIFYHRENYLSLKAGTYTLSTNITCSLYIQQTVDGTSNNLFIKYNSSSITFTLENDTNNLTVNLYVGTGIDHTATVQLEEGSTVTAYEPYTNTVYGGYVDLITGEVWATYGHVIDNGSVADNWSGDNPSSSIKRWIVAKHKFSDRPKNGSTNSLKVNYMKSSSTTAGWNAFIGSTGNFLCYVDETTTPDKAAWLAYLAENPLEIVYELETPILVATLTPTELSTLIGTTNIWCNAGNVEVEYDFAESWEMIQLKKQIMRATDPELPPWYKRVDYIQSDGSAYISTDVFTVDGLGFEVTYLTFSPIGSSNFGAIFGGRRGSGNNDFQLTTYTYQTSTHQGTLRYGNNYATDARGNAGIVVNTKQSSSLHQLHFTRPDGTSSDLSSYNFTESRPIDLFCLNDNGSHSQGGLGCRIYKMKFFDQNDNLIRNYVPCVRLSDSAPGFYETVGKVFLPKTGGGTLTAGND